MLTNASVPFPQPLVPQRGAPTLKTKAQVKGTSVWRRGGQQQCEVEKHRDWCVAVRQDDKRNGNHPGGMT